MNPSNLFSEIRNSKCAAFVFEKSPGGANRFRDRVIFYYDGKVRFERYCMGEAAGKVCELTAESLDERGAIAWTAKRKKPQRYLPVRAAAALCLTAKCRFGKSTAS